MFTLAHTAFVWIAPVLFVLMLIVTVHELGHFLVARAFGVAIDSFSIGFGRALLTHRDRRGVDWRIGWIPLGGYVRFAGDEHAASLPDSDDLAAMRRSIVAREGPAAISKYYHFKPVWQRSLIAAAGPFANFALAIVLFATVFMTVGVVQPPQNGAPARVEEVISGSAAAAGGFQVGDVVLRVNSRPIATFDELRTAVSSAAGSPLRFLVRRGGQDVMLIATPKSTVVKDSSGRTLTVGQLGVSDATRIRYPPWKALSEATVLTWYVLKTTVLTIIAIIQGHISASNLSGPLGIAQATHAAAQAGATGVHGLGDQLLGGFFNLLGLSAVISVGIGFMNLLPIPVLDGGHLLFYAYEALARRPVAAVVQVVSYRVGLALLIGLMLFATTNDLRRSSVFHLLGGLFS